MQAVAENAVIISDDGNYVRYHPRCPHCGKVHENLTSGVGCGNGIVASAGFHTCYQCHKNFQVRIIRR